LPRRSRSAQVTKLLLLTLSLEDALAEERWEEASALFESRDRLLDQLDPEQLEGIEEVKQAEVRLMRALRAQRAALAFDIANGLSGARVGKTYGVPPATGGYDLAS
jgi:hypothetical protein